VKTTAHCEDPGHAAAAPRAPNHTPTRRSPATRRHIFTGCARGCVPSSNASFRRSRLPRLPGCPAPFPDSRRLRGSALAPASLRDPTSGSIRPGIAVPRVTSWSSAPPHLPAARCRAGVSIEPAQVHRCPHRPLPSLAALPATWTSAVPRERSLRVEPARTTRRAAPPMSSYPYRSTMTRLL